MVPDPVGPTKKVKKNKLLLQVSVRELNNDVLKEVPECTVDDNVLVSDWKLRKLLPPEVRRMSNYYKTMCACIVCVQMKLHKSTYNRFKGKLLKQLKQEMDGLRLGSRSRRIALDKYNKYKEETKTSNTVSDALKDVHCTAVPVGSEDLLSHQLCIEQMSKVCQI